MKRVSVMALIMAAGIAGSSVLPVQAASADSACKQLEIKRYVVANGQAGSCEDLKEMLSEICRDYGLYWTDCPEVNQPETETPETSIPETEAPETETPETSTPETNAPETEAPQESSFAEQVAELVNAERRKAGLGELVLDQEIASAALVRAKEIETSFSHTRPDGRSFSSVLTDNGISFRGSGENIAWGQKTPQEVMDGWMNSEGHRANILNAKFTKIGVGYYQNASGRNFWTQLFTY